LGFLAHREPVSNLKIEDESILSTGIFPFRFVGSILCYPLYMPPEFLYILILVSALIGFSVSFYIYLKKSKNEEIFCPTNSDCNEVIYSRYSKVLFGIPNEDLGIGYFGLIFVSYILFFFFNFESVAIHPVYAFIAFLAFIFSVYLTYLQTAKIKEWCTWCVLATLSTTIIFFALITLILS